MYDLIGSKALKTYENIFNDDYFYSYANNGTCKINNTIGPIGGTSYDKNRISAIKKAISESIERRELMKNYNSKKKIKTLNLISNEIDTIDCKRFGFYENSDYYTDTTGTAAHEGSIESLTNAIKEILQKNALFYLWYLKKGTILKTPKNLPDIETNLENFLFFVNEDFFPLKTVLCVDISDNRFKAGVSCEFEIYLGVKKAYEEMRLIEVQENVNIKYGYSSYRMSKKDIVDHRNHILTLNNHLPVMDYKYYLSSTEIELFSFIKILPKKIKSLYFIQLNNPYNKKIKVTKVISNELISHIPQKKYLLSSKIIDKRYHNKILETIDCKIL